MDLKGQIVDTKIKIKPSKALVKYIRCLTIRNGMPNNIAKIINGENYELNKSCDDIKTEVKFKFSEEELKLLQKLKSSKDHQKDKQITENEDKETDQVKSKSKKKTSKDHQVDEQVTENKDKETDHVKSQSTEKASKDILNDKDEEVAEKVKIRDIEMVEDEPKSMNKTTKDIGKNNDYPFLSVDDVDWLYAHLQEIRKDGTKNVPFLHELLKDSEIEMPANAVIKRNPELEARCVKLRAQQEAREYRAMTKGVDNVRIRFPEDSISYQLKQLNRQLIAVGQFLLSIFAGFLFGFKGIELMLGGMDFGFRLLLGVMCALVIALAEIYFLAKKLNEELSIPETIQLGGPPKFANQSEVAKQATINNETKHATIQNGNKEHQE